MTMVRRLRVLLADEQPKVLSALRLLLNQVPGFQTVGEACEATSLLDQVRTVRPDLVLLDWELPGLPALNTLSALRANRPNLKVIALSGRPELGGTAITAGADFFVSKIDPPRKLLAALRTIYFEAVGPDNADYDENGSGSTSTEIKWKHVR
jgi:DNA-binding NarL/FixJ family response regulator